MARQKKHHYVPRFYLDGFTPDGNDDRLYVFDKETGRQWRSNLTNTACEKDFYVLEVEESGDSLALERLLGKFERDGAEAIRFLAENKAVPDGELYEKLMGFMGLMAVRSPDLIARIEKPFAQVSKSVLYQMTESPERFESLKAEMQEKGVDTTDWNWKEMHDFVRSDEYQISMSQNWKMDAIVTMLPDAAKLLASRSWSVIEAPAGCSFVCSDRPLSIDWISRSFGGFFSPGLGLTHTAVMFPINKTVALFGMFEKELLPVSVDEWGVAVVNLNTAYTARQYVYSTGEDFSVVLPDRSIGGKAAFLEAINDRSRAGD